jgi:hypothetical protein
MFTENPYVLHFPLVYTPKKSKHFVKQMPAPTSSDYQEDDWELL